MGSGAGPNSGGGRRSGGGGHQTGQRDMAERKKKTEIAKAEKQKARHNESGGGRGGDGGRGGGRDGGRGGRGDSTESVAMTAFNQNLVSGLLSGMSGGSGGGGGGDAPVDLSDARVDVDPEDVERKVVPHTRSCASLT